MSVQEQQLYEEFVDPKWNITKLPGVDNSTSKREYQTILDVNGGSAFSLHTPSTNLIRFEIPGTQEWVHLYDAYLKLQLRLVRADGSQLHQDDVVAFCNNVGFTLFQSALIKVDTVTVQSVDNVDHVTMLRLLTMLSKEELITRGPEFFFFDYPDDNVRSLTAANDPTEEFSVDVADGVDVVTGRNQHYNKSFTVRYNKSATNADITINLPLKYMFSFINDLNDLLIRMSKVELELNLSSNIGTKCVEVVSKGGGYTGGFKPWIKRMELKVPILDASAHVKAQLLQGFNNEAFTRVIYNDTFSTRHNDHTQGSSKINWRIASLPGKLNSVFIMFKIKNDEHSEDKVANVYDNALVRRLYVRVGSTMYPAEHIMCDFKQGDYSDAYVRFIESTKRLHNRIDEQSIVSWDNYPNKYPIFFVDLSNTIKEDASVSEDIWLEADLDIPDGGGPIPPYTIISIIEHERLMLLKMKSDGKIALV